MGSYLGAECSAAKKTGVSVEAWREFRAAGLRWCFGCRAWKRAGLFNSDKSRSGGRAQRCKCCQAVATAASRYGVTSAEVVARVAMAAGRCELCDRPTRKPVIDHHHRNGGIRWILCSACNVGLGLFGDDPAMLRQAVQYLERFNG